ncbi:bleomycin resistance protein [Chitiniphilus purpureus]|uniref:Bleomycin resistance protein n=1 Tax=Chitiniphilus purpureus TaxID=2981137 RepID=A0ABY6DRC2_9NEIS|nr:bleomycin resistance protein [Chitiniphilus sp. CD1]UXY16917.1 bleomycin resistance protein [Chitiniphilus sp. CD1]
MSDRATPNLPSRDFDLTQRFYAPLGFACTYRDDGWLILERDGLCLEFFAHPALDPASSWFSCCLRLDDVHAFHRICRAAGIPESTTGFPRLHRPEPQPWGGLMGALIDPDGTLLRLIQT